MLVHKYYNYYDSRGRWKRVMCTNVNVPWEVRPDMTYRWAEATCPDCLLKRRFFSK